MPTATSLAGTATRELAREISRRPAAERAAAFEAIGRSLDLVEATEPPEVVAELVERHLAADQD